MKDIIMSSCKQTAIQKFRSDTERFRIDHGLSSRISAIKLILVVEYWAVLYFRLCEFCSEERGVFRQLLKLILALFKPIVEGFTACRIRHGANIAGGLLLHHSMGVAIAVGAEIGENCTIFSCVTIAHKGNGMREGAPKIGNNVRLMAGCKVLGNVVIGDDSVIGANAVVLTDVPSKSLAIGVPAKITFLRHS